MNIGLSIEPEAKCEDCGNAGPGLREIEFRFSRYLTKLVLCPGCGHKLIQVLKIELSRPHLRVPSQP